MLLLHGRRHTHTYIHAHTHTHILTLFCCRLDDLGRSPIDVAVAWNMSEQVIAVIGVCLLSVCLSVCLSTPRITLVSWNMNMSEQVTPNVVVCSCVCLSACICIHSRIIP